MKSLKTMLLLILCNLFWAGNYVFGKYIGAEISPVGLTFLRWLIAVFFLFPLAQYFEKPKWHQVKKEWKTLTMMGITGMVIYNSTMYSALTYTSSTNAALVSALNPSLLVIFSAFLLKEKMTGKQGWGIGVSLTGVLIILTNGKLTQLFSMTYNQGDLLMLLAILAWTTFSILGRRLRKVPPITATAVSALIAVLIMAPFALLEGIDFSSLSTTAITGIIYIALFPSVISFAIWNMGIQEIGASRSGIFLNLIPVFTALISWMLGSSITLYQIAGGIFVFCGVSITTGIFRKKIVSPV